MYVGLYTVTKILGKGIYYVQHVENPERTVVSVSGIHLKLYCTPVKKGNDSCTRNTCIKGQPEVVCDGPLVPLELKQPALRNLRI